MIEVKNLTKYYGRHLAVNDISFSIKEGETVGFLGPNGAGKTTTMNMLTGYISATSGAAKVGSIDILKDPLSAKRHFGYLPAQPPLYPDMTVDGYLNFIYELKGVKAKSRGDHLKQKKKLTDVLDVSHRLIKPLSKEIKQRVALAGALIGDPDVLILDEPTTGLDPQQTVAMHSLIKGLGKSRTILLSTYSLPEISALCGRVLVMANGFIFADDHPENLSKVVSAGRNFTIRVAGARDSVFSLLRGCDGMVEVTVLAATEPGAFDYLVKAQPNVDLRHSVVRALTAANYPILKLVPQALSLEEIFLRLTSTESELIASLAGGAQGIAYESAGKEMPN